MAPRVKICGITRYEDARIACNCGADALGFIFYSRSPRYIAPADAGAIIRRLPPFITCVGVFVDESPVTIHAVAKKSGIDTVQLHGKEPPSISEALYPLHTIKSFSIATAQDVDAIAQYRCNGYLLDTWHESLHGGSGRTFNWSIARRAVGQYAHIILAGGLAPVNLADAVDTVRPWAVDLNSGVEIKPGQKNPRKIKQAIDIVKNGRM
jgi:phosphoribosylanthranilate isomerase